MRDTQREAETQAEGEAGSLWGAQHGILGPRDHALSPNADAQLPSHPDAPVLFLHQDSLAECLPSAQVVSPGSWDRVPHRAPCMEPASPSAYVSASLCVSLMNK